VAGRVENADFVPMGPWNTDGLLFVSRCASSSGAYARQLQAIWSSSSAVEHTPAVV
jgi:hypothetical protein